MPSDCSYKAEKNTIWLLRLIWNFQDIYEPNEDCYQINICTCQRSFQIYGQVDFRYFWTSLPSPVSTYMAESEKAKKHYQAHEANRNVHKALWAQVHNCRIIEAITVWLTTTSPTSSYGILESCRQQHYCHQHHHQHHYCRKKIITATSTAIITELTKTETSSANQDLRKAPSMTASWPPTIKFPELNELLNALILLAWFRLTKNWT